MASTLQIPIENSGFIEYAARLHWAKIWLEDIPLRKQMLASWLPWSCTSDHSQTRTIKLLLGLPATFPQYQEQNIHLWQWGTQLLSNHQPSSYCRYCLLHSLCLYNKTCIHVYMGYSITIMIRTKYWNPGTLHILDTVVFRRVHLLLLLKSNANCYICILWTYLFGGNRISESNFISQEDAAPALKLVLNLTWWRSDVAKLREAEQSSKW